MGGAAQPQLSRWTHLAPHGIGKPAGQTVRRRLRRIPGSTGQARSGGPAVGPADPCRAPISCLGRPAHRQRQRRVRLAVFSSRSSPTAAGASPWPRGDSPSPSGKQRRRPREHLGGAADDHAQVGDALPVVHFGHERSAFGLIERAASSPGGRREKEHFMAAIRRRQGAARLPPPRRPGEDGGGEADPASRNQSGSRCLFMCVAAIR